MYYSCVKFIKQPICEQHELYMKTERAEFNRESWTRDRFSSLELGSFVLWMELGSTLFWSGLEGFSDLLQVMGCFFEFRI